MSIQVVATEILRQRHILRLSPSRRVGRRRVETVTWLEYPVTGCSPFIDEVTNLEVRPILDDDQAQSQAAHGEFGLPHFVQAVYRRLDLQAGSFF